MRGLDVIIVEKEGAFGTGTSSRNSEVIHAGIYYPAGSLQARLCVEGKAMLYEYCRQRNIPHRRTGKLIVATSPEQVPKLQSIQARGMANGVNDLRLISGKEAIALEPELRCQAALLSPSTGIVSSHALMECLLADAQSHGAALVLGGSVVGGSVEGSTGPASSPPSPCSSVPSSSLSSSPASPAASDDVASSSSSSCSSVGGGAAVRSAAGDTAGHLQLAIRELATGQVQRVEAKYVINSAGLDATHVASRLHGLPSSCVPTPYLAKGNYFSLAASPASTSSSSSTSALTSTHVRNSRAPFQRLVYPVPEPGGLGIHYTIDLAGNAKFGPDVEWVDKVDYRVDPSRGQKFYASVRQYWPGLPDEALQPSYCGIRPKITGPGQPDADFLIQGSALHGIRGLVNLFGIGSPGLTSSLAIAEHVAKLLGR